MRINNIDCTDKERNQVIKEIEMVETRREEKPPKASQYRGVFRDNSGNGWRARITKNHIRYNLGTFDTQEEALEAFINKNKELSMTIGGIYGSDR